MGAARWIVARLPAPIASPIRAAYRRLFIDRAAELAYLAGGWPRETQAGWDHESVVEVQRDRWPTARERATAPNVVVGEGSTTAPPDLALHNTIMVFAYVLGRSLVGRQAVTLLDWGCGLGQYAVLARGLFPSATIRYFGRELPALSSAAKELLPGDTFFDTDADSFAGRYDLVMASGSVQYTQDWAGTLTGLAGAAEGWLFVARTPIVRTVPSFVIEQRPRSIGYRTTYPGWIINRGELIAVLTEAGFDLDREFLSGEHLYIPKAPEQPQVRAFLFRRGEASGSVNAAREP